MFSFPTDRTPGTGVSCVRSRPFTASPQCPFVPHGRQLRLPTPWPSLFDCGATVKHILSVAISLTVGGARPPAPNSLQRRLRSGQNAPNGELPAEAQALQWRSTTDGKTTRAIALDELVIFRDTESTRSSCTSPGSRIRGTIPPSSSDP